MNFLDLSKRRLSVRDYIDRPVEQEKLEYILECARMAPSAVNKQPWRFIVVKTDAMRKELQRCYDREWFSTAPLHIVVCGEHSESWKRPSDAKDHCDIDIAIATEHIALAATEVGLGSCWVCNFDAKLCKEILDLEESQEPIVILPIGYAKETTDIKNEKKRKGTDEIVSER